MRLSLNSIFIFLIILNLSAFATERPKETKDYQDPYLYLEEVEGEKALEFVNTENEKSLTLLTAQPEYEAILKDLKELQLADDRVPFSNFSNGYFWNVWKDREHPKGLIRRTTYESYKADKPEWEVLLDLDALAKNENEDWVYKGSVHFEEPKSRRILKLSRGGKDAVVFREYDYETKSFVKDNPFNLEESKARISPIDIDTVLVMGDFGEDSLTESKYPRTVRIWKRGEKPDSRSVVFEAQKTDMGVSAYEIQDAAHDYKAYFIFQRDIDFFNSEYFITDDLENLKLKKIEVPTTTSLVDILDEQYYFELKEDVTLKNGKQLNSGSLVRIPMNGNGIEDAELIFSTSKGQAISNVQVRKDRIVITLLEDVKSKILELKLNKENSWETKELKFFENGIVSLTLADSRDPTSFASMYYTDHLTPYSQYRVQEEGGVYSLEKLKSAPARFDASQFEVLQWKVKSKDGTEIPYFIIKSKNMKYDGKNPTILYGYGGFEVSLEPAYSATEVLAWVNRGGVYVIANIRGGGEFGPDWHQAALKLKRQNAYDDFIAVAEDLTAKKVTAKEHLGISGGSNGGLLTGAVMVQRPELFNAVLSSVPLLDMIRYVDLPAGASWIGEYGDPKNVIECENLLKISPYHNVKPGVKYPSPLFTTSTKDDRVHPGHARKMAKKMLDQGHEAYFYENTTGGHAGSADPESAARIDALEYTYFWLRLK